MSCLAPRSWSAISPSSRWKCSTRYVSHPMRKDLVDALTAASAATGSGLAQAAFVIARIEYPRLDPTPYLARLDAMGEAARQRIEEHVAESGDHTAIGPVRALNAYLFDEQGF